MFLAIRSSPHVSIDGRMRPRFYQDTTTQPRLAPCQEHVCGVRPSEACLPEIRKPQVGTATTVIDVFGLYGLYGRAWRN